ncbi:MAG: PrsW family intramembrane metalloprotease [Candidatus Bathyarchaeota archaeon]|nr:PrsW family intramembrane metalloprotease [Candidatus Bathyarchaeota archaeon]
MSVDDFIFYVLISVLPCIIWLLFYLRQDVNPESTKKIIEIFFLGMVMVLPALLLETFFESLMPTQRVDSSLLLLPIYYIVGVGLVEELLKYLVVKFRVIDSSHFDEPIDVIIYLIVAGLGFATIENIVVIFNIETLEEAAIISTIRLLTAIFIHTLSAAITGYFWAFSFTLNRRLKRGVSFVSGIIGASILHGVYDISIIKIETAQTLFSFLLPVVIIIFAGILVSILFSKVKKLSRTCKIKHADIYE